MAWMARTAAIRKELRLKWDWAHTALVGVFDYLSKPRDRQELRGIGRHIARYARGEDYHELVKRRLRRWAALIEDETGRAFRHVALVDTSAVLERELAARAGLGWFGRNSCLIGPRGNSWRFIGVLLTELDLPVCAVPVSERCGSCTACLDACPTDAFDGPYRVAASRCISYLTIEHRGAIPEELRQGIGDWLFGCDLCQEVCPWNRQVKPGEEPAWRVRPEYEALSLAELAGLDEEGFRAAFRRTPLARSKRAGLVRNALIVGANLGDAELARVAEELVDDPDEGVRDAARWVLRQREE